MGALVIEELDRLGVPEHVDGLPGVGSADHVDHAVDRDSAVGVGDAGGLADAAGSVLCEGRDGFRVSWLGDRCGFPCLSRGDPPWQALVRAFVLALRGWFVRFPGDRLDPQGGDVREEPALMAPP